MTPREASRQQPPSAQLDLTDFPRVRVEATPTWFRCHQQVHSTWYYSSHPQHETGGGRWDLTEPDGTCYLAETARAALLETAGPDLIELGFITSAWAEARTISETPLQHLGDAADLTSTEISRWGATSELMGALSYSITQAWAQAWRDVGLDGVRYPMRFAANYIGLAVFGAAGHPGDPPPNSAAHSVREVAREAGLRVVDAPHSRDLEYAPSPW